MDYDKLIERLRTDSLYADKASLEIMDLCMDAATAIETLRAENEKLRAELEQARESLDFARTKDAEIIRLGADLARVTAERDAAVKAVKNMAEYIVCAGRVDYYLCDEISQEHHLKYQPKNDGNYDNEPCYKCIADWFLQGHKWQESE